jgi:Tol biopolymer transport system component
LRKILFALAAIFFAGLTISNLRSLKDRSADFSRRIATPSVGYGTFAAVKAGDHILLNEMILEGYGAVRLRDGDVQKMPAPGDVLAIAASPQSQFVYFELANKSSQIFRMLASQIGQAKAMPEYFADGEDPAISSDGRWLAFLREERKGRTVWISQNGAQPAPVTVSGSGAQNVPEILEMTITSEGSILASAGSAADSHFVLWHTGTGQLIPLNEITGAVRYPAISPDGKQLAFSRRESGSWHLFVHDLETNAEQRLTLGSCNATSPSWEDAQSLLYVTDCGRGLALGAPTRVRLDPANR